jgi:hypothetical protein
VPGDHLGGAQPSLERLMLVQIAVVQIGQHGFEGVPGGTDVDHCRVLVEFATEERGLHHVRGAVQRLSRTEERVGQGMGDHGVAADGDAVHQSSGE